MTQKFIFGIDVTPRKEYREEIVRLNCLLEEEKSLSKELLSERNDYIEKYNSLLNDTPARDKNGKYAKRKK